MLISAIAIIVMAICAMVLFYDILKKQIFDDLKANAHVISMMNPEDLPDEINYNLNKDGLRITLINEDGTVIYDSMEDESKMEITGNDRRSLLHWQPERGVRCGNRLRPQNILFIMQ